MHTPVGFRGALALGLGATLVASVAAPAAATAAPAPGEQARNVILFIGDGMGQTHVDAARQVAVGAAGQLDMETLPVRGAVSTWAVLPESDTPELVTDSASAATAWSSGRKTYNAAIGVDAYGEILPTLMEQAKGAGMRTGNVSTAEVTDATPAAQFSHAALRGCQGPTYSLESCGTLGGQPYLPIAQQIARNDVADVILGGGNNRFTAEDQAVMEGNGYTVLGELGAQVATGDELQAVRDGSEQRVIGLFNTGNLTPEVNKAKAFPTPAVQEEPSLSQMTQAAIGLLAKSRDARQNGFFLQVEGANIDKRSHANDAAQTIGETIEFDNAIAVAKRFAAKDKNTLVIVTADHECAGFNIIGKGSYTNAEAVTPPGNQSGTSSTETPVRTESGALDPERSTGPVNGSGSADPTNFAPATFRTADDPAGVEDGSPEASLWLTYLSGNHTGADVPLFAGGKGSEIFSGNQDNTDLYGKILAATKALSTP
ncbi:alkaline phosphatase [Cellulomonas endophytica]|uniref:alkaline phosphatase n=1 Tax=Cellulomonas endophytica TaxID=2494735 RepID=UPI001010DD14|nr:alkaline phosphatase [Cellulomonas endophytica]